MPLVAENDHGIRPAGKPDECFYCQRKIGEQHKPGCVVVQKKVRVEYTFTLELYIPHHWEPEHFEFDRNENTWCAANAIQELQDAAEDNGCLCGKFKAKFVEVLDDTPVIPENSLVKE